MHFEIASIKNIGFVFFLSRERERESCDPTLWALDSLERYNSAEIGNS